MSFHRGGGFAANPKIPLTLLAKPNPIPTSFSQLTCHRSFREETIVRVTGKNFYCGELSVLLLLFRMFLQAE